jgi:hypothetical protein
MESGGRIIGRIGGEFDRFDGAIGKHGRGRKKGRNGNTGQKEPTKRREHHPWRATKITRYVRD